MAPRVVKIGFDLRLQQNEQAEAFSPSQRIRVVDSLVVLVLQRTSTFNLDFNLFGTIVTSVLPQLFTASLVEKKPIQATTNTLVTMKYSSGALLFLSLAAGSVQAFSPNASPAAHQSHLFSAVADEKAKSSSAGKTQDPLLIRAAKGEKVERPPVWMMRQAGRHMKIYRDLCKTHTTFRQRSEIPEVAVEISLQPYEAYKTDGCILFSDILTPFPAMGMDFTIDEKLGPVMPTIRSFEELKQVRRVFIFRSC